MSGVGDRRWRIRWLEDQHYNEDDNGHENHEGHNDNKRHKNTISDFMDELDHEEWGGPKGVSTNFDNTKANINNNIGGAIPGSMHNELVDILLNPIVGSIGKRLLHKIGYVDKQEEHKLPNVKTNVYGIGYDPYLGASEFKNELLERKHRATQRWETKEDVIAKNNVVDISREDFIGYKTSTGFAINDEDDDVYDDAPNKKEFYLTHEEDNDNAAKLKHKAITDNNAPIPLFCKSTLLDLFQPVRYAGPQPPSTYKENEFMLPNINTPNTNDNNSSSHLTQAPRPALLNKGGLTSKQSSNGPMTGSNFANIAILMNNRFTSSSSTTTTPSTTKYGLSKPTKYNKPPEQTSTASKQQKIVPKRIPIQKNTYTWIPSSLLCKRFHVVPNEHIQTFQQTNNDQGQNNAAPSEFDHHFSTHILPQVTTNNANATNNKNEESNKTTQSSQPSKLNSINADYNATRPSKEIFKSIFESTSDNEKSNNDDNQIDLTSNSTKPENGSHCTNNTRIASINNNTPSKAKIKENKYDASNNDTHSISSSSSSSYSRRKRSRKKEKRKKSYKRKRHYKDDKYSKHHHRSKKHKRKKSI